mmetsp:Transcript_36816/g.87048  ORF Transcript_36816/g.87048 Transcript_36816/m.87048 type:complete len:497 (+) Transcript_36816:51-1541(+)
MIKSSSACLVVVTMSLGLTACWGLQPWASSPAFATPSPVRGVIHHNSMSNSMQKQSCRFACQQQAGASLRERGGVLALFASGRRESGGNFQKRSAGGLTLYMGDGLAGILENNTLKRVIIWVVFGGFLYLCKPFYGVIIGTFVMSFVGNSVVNTLESQATAIRNFVIKKHNFHLPPVSRKVIAFFYIIIVLNVLIAFTVVTVPQVVESWRYLKQIMLSDNPYVELASSICGFIGPDGTARLEVLLSSLYGDAPKVMKGIEAPMLTHTLQSSLKGYVLAALPTFNKLLRGGTEVFYQLMVSLLFSSICIYDKGRITRGVKLLGNDNSLVRTAYKELAPRISFFGRLVGKSLEAQLLIACWNTFLTTAGLFVLRIPAAAALSILVFFCSFIPLAGVIISTLPMAIVALSEAGLMKVFQIFLMVFVVHAIEAYFLNPQIYSSKLQLHPLLVLMSLYITEKLVGVTALFLAVPVTVFIIKVILRDTQDDPAVISLPPSSK